MPGGKFGFGAQTASGPESLVSDRVSEYREAYPCEADPDSSGLEAVGSAAVEALWSPGKVVCLELDWL